MTPYFPAVCRAIAYAAIAASIFASLLLTHETHAAALRFVSDTIALSGPATSTSHTIRFQTTQAVPASGKIFIEFQPGQFTIPGGFDFLDVDLATSSSQAGPFTDRTLAASANATSDGVSVITGASGSATITLNSTFGITADTFVELQLGTIATFGGTGDSKIVNPSISNSTYSLSAQTRDAADNPLDASQMLIAIVDPVTATGEGGDDLPPVRSNSQPTGVLPNGTTQVALSLNTNEIADCRYDMVAGTAYASMPSVFTTSSSTFHSSNLSGLISGATYTFFVRCSDKQPIPNINPDDFIITFSISGTIPPPTPPGGGGSGPSGGAPFPSQSSPEVIIEGVAYPFADMTVLKDGQGPILVKADSFGRFNTTMPVSTQGAYSFSVSARDTEGRTSLAVTSSFTIVTNSRNVTNFIISPTLAPTTEQVGAGETIIIKGQAQIGSDVEVWVYQQEREREADRFAKKTTVKAGTDGKWSLNFPTAGLPNGTYSSKARAILSPAQATDLGKIAYFGIGQAPTPDFCIRADINKDGRINLVDFSIMLFNWQTSDAASDINSDGRVNLTDFSIMLFCWSG